MVKYWEVIMPNLESGKEPVLIAEWLVKSGDRVYNRKPVAVLETDKSTIEMESDYDGYIFLIAEEGTEKLQGEIIAVITRENDSSIVNTLY